MKTTIWFVLIAIGILSCQSTAVADDQSRRKAAEDLLVVMNVQQTMDDAIDQMIDMQMKANPQMAPMSNVLKQWAAKVLSYASLKDELIKIYAGELTEDELKQLAAFYKTPVGKRWIEAMPKINAKVTPARRGPGPSSPARTSKNDPRRTKQTGCSPSSN